MILTNSLPDSQNQVIDIFLINQNFIRETATMYRFNGKATEALVNRIVKFFKGYGEPIKLDDGCNVLLQDIENAIQDFSLKAKEGIRIKKMRDVPDIAIPRMNPKNRLTEYQLLPVLHAHRLGNTANFSVPGSGKTWMSYATYFLSREATSTDDSPVDRLLVIGPLSSFRPWEDEYAEMTGKQPNSIRITGTPENRKEIFSKADKYEIFLIGYRTVVNELERITKLMKKYKFFIIVDESHHIKNPDSASSCAIRKISKFAHKRMILTGTMMPNDVQDLWAQFRFLYPNGELVGNFDNFRYSLKETGAMDNLREKLYPFYTRISKSRLELPEQEIIRPPAVRMGSIQRRIYSTIAGHIKKQDPNYRDDIFAMRKWRKKSIIYLLEASTDPSLLTKNSQFNEELISSTGLSIDKLLDNYSNFEVPGKLRAVRELAVTNLKNKTKIIIWCSFIGTIKKLEQMLIDYKPLTIYGEIPSNDEVYKDDNREKRINKFKSSRLHNLLIANPASLAESISLHKVCHHAIYVDRTFNGGHYMQSLERIHRVGMDPNVKTRYTIFQSEDSIDQKIDSRLEEKKARMERFLYDDSFQPLNLEMEYDNPIGTDNELDDDYKAVLESLGD